MSATPARKKTAAPRKTAAKAPSAQEREIADLKAQLAALSGGEQPVAKAAPRRAAASRPVAPEDKHVRNLRTVPVHLRLGPQRDPFRVQLQPRGQSGDYDTIPAKFVSGLKDVGVLYEIITETEKRELEYGPAFYAEREQITILRDADTVISTQENWDGKGRAPQHREPVQRRDSRGHAIPENDRLDVGAGPRFADVPGSDAAVHQGLREGARNAADPGDAALPPGVSFDRHVTVERTRG